MKTVVCVLVFVCSVSGQGDYCSITTEHTLCKYEGVGPVCGDTLARGVTNMERRMVVDYHNRYHNKAY